MMAIKGIIPQLRTTDMESSVRFDTEQLGFSIEFRYEDFYTGIRAGDDVFHLKLVDDDDPSIDYVRDGEHFHLYLRADGVGEIAKRLKDKGVDLVEDVHDTPWGTREIVLNDDQGHTLYIGEPV